MPGVSILKAKRVLEQVSIAESAVERLRATPAGTLRVTAPTSFGGCVIAPLTATFAALPGGAHRAGSD
jgi:DNA-binding transcriptional LysR family regulator